MNRLLSVAVVLGLIITIAIVIDACGTSPNTVQKQAQESMNSVELKLLSGNYGLSRFYDKDAGVVCWIYLSSYGVGLSCLPITSTLLREQ